MIVKHLARLVSSAIYITFAFPCTAQDAKIELQFVLFPKHAGHEIVELRVGPDETIEVELPTNSLSPVYRVDALSEWAIGKSGTNEEGEFTFDVFGKTEAISSKKQLILVQPDAREDTEKFKLTSFQLDQSGFSRGKYLFLNVTKVDIAIQIGDSELALKPGQHQLVKPKASKVKNDRKYLHVYIYFKKGEEAQPFYSSTWRFIDNARTMVFFYHEPVHGQLKHHSIINYLAP